MTLFPSREILRRRADIALIAAFFALIWLPLADSLLHWDKTPSPNENRALAARPEFKPTLAGVRAFSAGFEAYFNDHFGFRRRLVRLNQHLKWQVFRHARTSSALAGKDGWLFFSGGVMLDDVRGAHPFTTGELEGWRRLLEGRRDWLAQRGIRYLFVVPPEKHTVYPEHLPDWLVQAPRERRRIGQFLHHMRTHSDVPVLDLHETMLAAKKLGILYRQTDTHWNQLGAFVASREVIRAAAGLGIAATPPDLSAFEATPAELPQGDLARMLGSGKHFTDRGDIVLSPSRPLPPYEYRKMEGTLPKDREPDFGTIVTKNAAGTGTVLMFHDSFAEPWFRFLGHSFAQATFVWEQNWDKRVFDMVKPDLVIDEMIERYVIGVDPELIRQLDEQPAKKLLNGRQGER